MIRPVCIMITPHRIDRVFNVLIEIFTNLEVVWNFCGLTPQKVFWFHKKLLLFGRSYEYFEKRQYWFLHGEQSKSEEITASSPLNVTLGLHKYALMDNLSFVLLLFTNNSHCNNNTKILLVHISSTHDRTYVPPVNDWTIGHNHWVAVWRKSDIARR